MRKVHALMPDGTVRAITWTGEADTFFSRPARVTVKGRTVRGSAYHASDTVTTGQYRFNDDGTEIERPTTVDVPASAADVFYGDAPGIRSGVLRFVGRGVNAFLIAPHAPGCVDAPHPIDAPCVGSDRFPLVSPES